MFRPPLAGRVTAPAPFPEYDGDYVVQPDFSLGLFLPASATEAQLRAISSLFARVREFVNACRRRQDSLSLWDSALGSPRVDASGTSPTSSFAAGNIYKSLSNHITSFSSVSSPNISAKFVSSRLSLPAPGGSSVAMLDCLPSDMAGFDNSVDNVLKPLSLQPGCQCKAVSL